MLQPLLPGGSVPVVETERLILRGHRTDDFSDCIALWTDPEITRFIGGKPSTREEVWARLLRYVGHWALLGFGYWAVEEKATGRFAGEVGFADFRRQIEPSLDGVPEIGWVIAPHGHGKGYATEAARAAIAWADGHFGPGRTACIIAPENEPSLRVAEKCGYRESCRTSYKDNPTIMFVRESA
ncbi:RimJ/RimL family protein N-acetyltransferase [Microvirga flocculans]|uniref:RimJ/RimL family protein N-acetyltransferase n=1 Tax=Microvirga flocculans TaxID=217168 RepID=A0A7W6IC59_9HYPH|nr:GNAT family N-acetyltransferase [Microvirga flocculans]MBB4038757.1 RimJ/RimL family protein N-acetyltransferase [Microvirga flocculans]